MDALSPRPRLKVFVIDDDAAVRDSIKVLLEVHGIEVEDYASADAFARGYRRPCRGCLVLDQNLPALSGVDFLNSPAGRGLGLPIILITGRGDAELERRARAAGATEFLQKPVSRHLLIATIERLTAGQDCRAR
jgi:FixJ family two-component response regulator